jgi:hypothetical protein
VLLARVFHSLVLRALLARATRACSLREPSLVPFTHYYKVSRNVRVNPRTKKNAPIYKKTTPNEMMLSVVLCHDVFQVIWDRAI